MLKMPGTVPKQIITNQTVCVCVCVCVCAGPRNIFCSCLVLITNIFLIRCAGMQGWVVGVLGCMAERLQQQLLDKHRGVDLVVGPDAYRDLPRLLSSLQVEACHPVASFACQSSEDMLLSRKRL